MLGAMTQLQTFSFSFHIPSLFADFPLENLKEVMIYKWWWWSDYNEEDVRKCAPNAVVVPGVPGPVVRIK